MHTQYPTPLVKSLLNQAGLFRFSKSCAINSVCSISDTVSGFVMVFLKRRATISPSTSIVIYSVGSEYRGCSRNNQSVHFHRDIFCRLRVSGMLPIIHCLLITHVIILLYMVCCQVCSSSWSSSAWPWAIFFCRSFRSALLSAW